MLGEAAFSSFERMKQRFEPEVDMPRYVVERTFDGALPIAVATVSGDVDLGSTALTGGLYNMASQGAMRVVAAQSADVPSFQNNTVIVSTSSIIGAVRRSRLRATGPCVRSWPGLRCIR